MMTSRPLFIPVILGTPRQGRMSEHVAMFMLEEVTKRDGIETSLIDIRKFVRDSDDTFRYPIEAGHFNYRFNRQRKSIPCES